MRSQLFGSPIEAQATNVFCRTNVIATAKLPIEVFWSYTRDLAKLIECGPLEKSLMKILQSMG